MVKTFKTRSPERDLATDVKRRKVIAEVIEQQRTLMAEELEGLVRRMEAELSLAAFAVEAEGSWGERDPEDEVAIAGSEQAAAASRGRIDELKREVALMNELKGRLGAV